MNRNGYRARPLATLAGLWMACSAAGSGASAQTLAEMADLGSRPPLTFNGAPGVIEMPSARVGPDGDLAVTLGYFGGQTRTTVDFQITPRLSGSFRYIAIENFRSPGGPLPTTYYDRSFDARYQILREGPVRPAVAIGLVDVAGTGRLSSEYVAATKTLGPVQVTGGLGFGRLATRNGFDNPLAGLDDRFATRPINGTDDRTGRSNLNRLFRGDAALFGGVTWDVTPRLTVMGEYASERRAGDDNPYNVGATYRLRSGLDLGLYALRGTDLGVRVSYRINPAVPPFANGRDEGPVPVLSRDGHDGPPSQAGGATVDSRLQGALAGDGLVLESITRTGHQVTVRVRNASFHRPAQAVGRTLRHLTRLMPPAVEILTVELSEKGLPVSATTLRRSLIEAAVFDPFAIERTYAGARVGRPADLGPARPDIRVAKLSHEIAPYLNRSFFDPRAPLLYDAGLRADVAYEPRPGLILSFGLEQPVVSNRDRTDRVSDSILPRVRSESDDYYRGAGSRLPYAQATYLFRPGPHSHARISAGYLEQSFAGLSGEVLWMPDNSRLAYGVELNAVRQRQPGSLTGLGTGVYGRRSITGHVSAYYDFDAGYFAQIDVGRYLAGDTGATLTLSRDYDNGARVGAFATLTDVSFDDFGEGAFDKGVFVTLPVSWLTGRPSRIDTSLTLRPILRDGGARLNVRDRLYRLVGTSDARAVNESWGRMLR